jgi:hypothetical protein
VIAIVRPDAWDLPLFVHVLGAACLFGGTLAITTLGFAALRLEAQGAMLRRLAFLSTLLAVWPAFIAMRVGAQWIYSKEDLHPDFPRWIAVGVAVGDGGVVVLLVLTVLAWLSLRRWPRATALFAWVSALYLLALGVAWWAMSAKPGA